MRFGNLAGRSVLIEGEVALDVETASGGQWPSDPMAAWRVWPEFATWAAGVPVAANGAAQRFHPADLLLPVPSPSQVFGIGVNYAAHAAETGHGGQGEPMVFTKFPSSLAGPRADVVLSGDRVDWEAELVVVIGATARDLPVEGAWDAVAGLAVGQDLSDRTVQNRNSPAQFSLGKSFAGYGPFGPWVTDTAELAAGGHDRDALRITDVLTRDGADEVLQDGTTADMIFPVAELVSRLSAIVELRPGDLIFTGTPPGVGVGRDPQRFLQAGDVLTTRIEGLGSIRQHFAER